MRRAWDMVSEAGRRVETLRIEQVVGQLAEHVGLGSLVAGNLPGVSYVFAEAR